MGLIQIPKQEKTEALTVRLPVPVIQQLREYMSFLGTDNAGKTIGAMIHYVTSKDKDFHDWKKEGGHENI